MKKFKLKIITILGVIAMSFFQLQAIGPGDKVENFTLNDYNGKPHSLTDYQNSKAIVLIFLSTKCPVSNAYVERIANLYATYQPKNIVFLGINANRSEDAAMIKAHCEKTGLKFPVLKDEDNVIADKLGAKVTPEVFVLSPALTVLYHGHIDDSQREAQVKQSGLRDALEAILAGKEIPDPVTKPFGCSIKRERE
jgi:peroxiredoxin